MYVDANWFNAYEWPANGWEGGGGGPPPVTSDGGLVFVLDGSEDNRRLDGASDGQVLWHLVTSFQDLGDANWKQLITVTPHFVAESPPAFVVDARFDFNRDEITNIVLPSPAPVGNVWDSGLWDFAIWTTGVDIGVPTSYRYGVAGMGRYVSIALKGASNGECILVGFEVVVRKGGIS